MLTSFKQMMQRAVKVETKTGLISSVMVWDIEAHYFRSPCLFHNTSPKVQTQNFYTKDSFYPKIFNTQVSISTLSYDNTIEPAKKEDKKKILRV